VERLLCEIRTLMWEKVGVIRRGKDLSDAANRLQAIALPDAPLSRESYEALNILEVARAIACSALAREESLGAHYRTDYPLKDEAALPKHSYISKNSKVTFSPDAPGIALPQVSGR